MDGSKLIGVVGLFSFLKGKPKADLVQLMRDGAKLVDVRTKGEYSEGHAKGTSNVPLPEIQPRRKLGKKTKLLSSAAEAA